MANIDDPLAPNDNPSTWLLVVGASIPRADHGANHRWRFVSKPSAADDEIAADRGPPTTKQQRHSTSTQIARLLLPRTTCRPAPFLLSRASALPAPSRAGAHAPSAGVLATIDSACTPPLISSSSSCAAASREGLALRAPPLSTRSMKAAPQPGWRTCAVQEEGRSTHLVDEAVPLDERHPLELSGHDLDTAGGRAGSWAQHTAGAGSGSSAGAGPKPPKAQQPRRCKTQGAAHSREVCLAGAQPVHRVVPRMLARVVHDLQRLRAQRLLREGMARGGTRSRPSHTSLWPAKRLAGGRDCPP